MTDPTPRDTDDTTPIEPAPAAPVAAAPAPAPVRSRWYGRRTPLLIAGAALVLGCLLGGSGVGLAASVIDDHGNHNSHDEHADGRGGENNRHQRNRNGDRRPDGQATPTPSTPASTAPETSAPTPTAST
ncbi:hypothetical protein [Actinoplanes sp. M2I2]|uniref:hypothetical protein n=1 Tax=Actinoplanes sp. M2I2 TaxID=1734444 RepID=UPI002020C26B|nr:hypothetical protein [Actinoplanes sp. M2I2]